MRGLWGFAVLCVCTLAFGQGLGGGGFGQGGQGGQGPLGQGAFGGGGIGGGGFGGGSRSGAFDYGGGEVSEHILTQGDKTSWPIKAKPGEGIVITVTSEVFDPTVELTDAKDNVIVQNDDVEPGNQMARVITDFDAEGEYKVRVSNYRSSAGGKYRISVRRFKVLRAKLGEEVQTEGDDIVFVKLALQKDKWYSFGKGADANSGGFEVDGGTDVHRRNVRFGNMPAVYRADRDGARYFGVNANYLRNMNASWSLYEIPVIPQARAGATGATLNGAGFAIFSIELEKGDAWEVFNRGSDSRGFYYPEEKGRPEVVYMGKANRLAALFAPEKYTALELVTGRPGATVSTELKPLGISMAGDRVTGKLALGDAVVYKLASQAFDLETFSAQSSSFDGQIYVLNDRGQVLGYSDDGDGVNPSFTNASPRSGPVYLVVSSLGYGGGGDFVATKKSSPPKELSLGRREATSGLFVYRIRARAGVVYQLTSSQVQAAFSDDEGQLTMSHASLGDRDATFARAKKDGWIYVTGRAFEKAWLRIDEAP